jgi:hypothetical protein
MTDHKYIYKVVEDNGGGLHLYVFWGSKVIYAATDYEYAPGRLTQDLRALDEGTDISRWDSNVDDPQAAYDSITSHEYGWKVVASGGGGQRHLHKSVMGGAAQIEFGVSDDERDMSGYASLLGRKGGSRTSARKAASSRINGRKGGRPHKKNRG